MDISFLGDYLVVIVTGICLCVGGIIKNFVPSDKVNKYIPLIMGVLGVLLNVWYNDWLFTPSVLLGGLASGLASTGLYEIGKNLIKTEDKK